MNRPVVVEGSRRYRLIQTALLVAFLAVVAFIPQRYPPFRVYQFTLVFTYAIAVLGLNMLTGFAGQISLGHSAFFALGAYTTAVLTLDHGWSWMLTLPVAFAVCFLAGLVFGVPALRLQGLYLALVTLSLAVVAPPLIKRFQDLTGGSQGRVVPKPVAPAWSGLADDQWQYWVAFAVAALLFVVARNLLTGRVGRALRAVRDNELAAEAMGVNLAVFKTLVFAYSAAYAGVAGALFGVFVGFVSPESFTVVLAISLLSAMVVGGLGSIPGALFGALFIVFLPDYAADVDQALSGVIYGVALIVVMLVMPGGVMGLVHRARAAVVTIRPRPATAP